MKHNIALSTATGISALLLATSCGHKSSDSGTYPTETVSVALPVTDTVILSNSYPGYLSANSSVDVVARVNGQILTKNFTNGSYVKKGDVLFTLDSSIYRDAVQQAQATLTTALSTRDYAESHYEAVKKALESEAVSKMEVIQAENALKQAEASIKNARAALETAQRDLSYCTITAPISGHITKDIHSVGSYISGAGNPVTLTTIYDNTLMIAKFAIEDGRYLDIVNSEGKRDSLDFDHVPVSFSESLPHSYTGYISYMAPALQTTTGTLEINCKINNPYDELRAGMYVMVNLPYARVPDAILVRDASISSDQLGKYLYVVNDSDKVVYTPVQVGELVHDSLRVITSGIRPTDRYVTTAMLKVRDGMTVNPKLIK